MLPSSVSTDRAHTLLELAMLGLFIALLAGAAAVSLGVTAVRPLLAPAIFAGAVLVGSEPWLRPDAGGVALAGGTLVGLAGFAGLALSATGEPSFGNPAVAAASIVGVVLVTVGR